MSVDRLLAGTFDRRFVSRTPAEQQRASHARLKIRGYYDAACDVCGVTVSRKFGKAALKPPLCRRHGAIRRETRRREGAILSSAETKYRAHAAAMPNAYCPNPYPGADACMAFAPHAHCECGVPIPPDDSVKCHHDPIVNFEALFDRFPAYLILT